MQSNIPDPSVRRLSAYLRQLESLEARGVDRVSSQQLAEYLKVGAAQVRRDLALFGQFGRRGVGYEVKDMIEVLRDILGTRQSWNVIVVGAGPLSVALLRYPGFVQRGFRLVAALDVEAGKVGTRVGEVEVRHMDELAAVVRETGAKLAILAVPPEAAQKATDALVEAGIEGILNFSTTGLETPPEVRVSQVDITAHLEQLSFLVTNAATSSKDEE